MSETQLELIVDNTNPASSETTKAGEVAILSYINSAFSKILPTLQLAWDSTSLGEFKQCQRRYQYTIIEGWIPRGDINVHLKFGIDLHGALELYEHNRAAGISHKQAQINAVRFALTVTWDKELNRPWISDDPNKNRETLIRSIIDYLDKYENDPLKTFILANEKAAVELSFRLELDKRTIVSKIDCPICFGTGIVTVYTSTTTGYEYAPGEIPVREDLHVLGDNLGPLIEKDFSEHEETCENCNGTGEVGETYLLCGHFDRIVEYQNELWISDVKTTKKTLNNGYFAQYSPDNQISLYSYAGKLVLPKSTTEEIKGVIINAIQILVNETKFDRREIKQSESQLTEWISETEYYISLAEIAAERNYWVKNEKACGQVYENPDTGELSYSCPFRPVCSSAPEIRETLLKLNYDKRIWDPLRTREKDIKKGGKNKCL